MMPSSTIMMMIMAILKITVIMTVITQGPMLKEDERVAYQAAFNTFDWLKKRNKH